LIYAAAELISLHHDSTSDSIYHQHTTWLSYLLTWRSSISSTVHQLTVNNIGVAAQPVLGTRHFCPKIYVWKISKMPKFYMVFARKMPKFCMILPEKYFSWIFLRGSPSSPAPMIDYQYSC